MNITTADYFTFNVDNSMLLLGQTGTGKSYLEEKLIYKFISGYTPDELQFIFLDMTGVDFREIEKKYPNYVDTKIEFDSKKGIEKLEELAVLSTKRIIKHKKQPMLFICIEECDMAAIAQERFYKALIIINQNAKAANMKTIYSTSRPSKDTISKQLIGSFDVILAGSLVSRTDEDQISSPHLPGLKRGDFRVIYPGRDSVDTVKKRPESKKILLIEDDRNLADVYAERLSQEGYEMSVAYNGESALPMAVKIMPDLIITGILMPKISGFDVLDILKNTKETKDIPVLVLSALHQPKDIDKARKLGAIDYMVKSQVVVAEVIEVIKDVMSGDYQAFRFSDTNNVSKKL